MLIRGKVHDKFKKQIAVCGLIFDNRVSRLRPELDFDFDNWGVIQLVLYNWFSDICRS